MKFTDLRGGWTAQNAACRHILVDGSGPMDHVPGIQLRTLRILIGGQSVSAGVPGPGKPSSLATSRGATAEIPLGEVRCTV